MTNICWPPVVFPVTIADCIQKEEKEQNMNALFYHLSYFYVGSKSYLVVGPPTSLLTSRNDLVKMHSLQSLKK